MSNQFNYELDERQIRILMQNVELEYDESAWQKFQVISANEQRQPIPIALPKLNFGISRSVIVPIFFILIIGGLSALLFSFVDFKKKEEIIPEFAYTKPSITKKIPTTNSVTIKPIAVVAVKTDSIKPVATSSIVTSEVISEAVVITENTEKKTTVIEPKIKPEEKNTDAYNVKKEVLVASKEKKENPQHVDKIKKKNKKRKQAIEDLPTINTSITNLNEGTKISELEIK